MMNLSPDTCLCDFYHEVLAMQKLNNKLPIHAVYCKNNFLKL